MGSLLADGVGLVDVVDATNFQVVGAVCSGGQQGEQSQEEHNELHSDQKTIILIGYFMVIQQDFEGGRTWRFLGREIREILKGLVGLACMTPNRPSQVFFIPVLWFICTLPAHNMSHFTTYLPTNPLLLFPHPHFSNNNQPHVPSLYNISTHMIQEQQSRPFQFLNGEYARLKIKMQPQSLTLQVPLAWQINKIKCLLVKMIPRLEFDMFVFKHDGEQLNGQQILKTVIEGDSDQACINSEYYVLTFAKVDNKEPQFQRYYSKKMSKLIGQLQRSPFQPILHAGYYKMKRINQLKQDGNSEVVAKFQHIQQMQNVMQEQRRQVVENQGVWAGMVGWGAGLLNEGGNNQGRGILHWVGVGLIRIIQLLSLLTILRYVAYNADINSFIILAVVLIAYFLIDYLKKHNRKQRGIQQNNQAQVKLKIEARQVSFVEKMVYRALVVIVERSCLVAEFFVAYILSLFPNWAVESHKDWFQDTCKSIDQVLAVWNLKITPIPLAPQQPGPEGLQSQGQPVAEQNAEPTQQKQHEQ